MAIVVAIFLLGVGAALLWMLDPSASGVDVSTLGVVVIGLGAGVLAWRLVSAIGASGRAVDSERDSSSFAPEADKTPEDEAFPFGPGQPRERRPF